MKKKIRNILLIIFGALALTIILVILFISPLTKYFIEKYDEKILGRQVTLDWAYVNPFTGYVYLNHVKVFEQKSDSVFFSSDGLGLSIGIRKLLSKTYRITGLTLTKPRIIFIQNGKKNDLNLNDIIDKFSSKDSIRDTLKPATLFSLEDVKIINGEVHYRQTEIPVNYFVKEVNIDSPGYFSDKDTLTASYSFLAGIGTGKLQGDFRMNVKTLEYDLSSLIKKLDLQFIEQYMKDFSNYGSFRANLDADIRAKGNFNSARKLDAKGKVTINDFHFGKSRAEDYASFDRFSFDMIDLRPFKQKYVFDSVLLHKPYFKYERYDHLDNIQNIFGRKGSNVKEVHQQEEHFNLILEIADYVEKLAKSFFRSYYKINRLEITKADFIYNDFTLGEKFSMGIDPLNLAADSIDKDRKRVRLQAHSGIKPYGIVSAVLSINPKDSGDFDLSTRLEKVPLALFNPYLVSYTSFPLDRGTVDFRSEWHVRNSKIQSQNHLILIDPRTAKRVKDKDAKWVPVPLVMAFVRERGNVIDYEIPITGDLKNPKFHLWDVITDLLENIVIKPPTLPYQVKVHQVETGIEKSIILRWETNKFSLREGEEKFVRHIAHFLKKDKNASIVVHPVEFKEKEKEHILLFEAKKKFYLHSNGRKDGQLSKEDSLQIVKMSIKDSAFTRFLNSHAGKKLVFTAQEKAAHLIDAKVLDEKLNELEEKRTHEFLNYFKESGLEDRVKLSATKNAVPYNGFSYFKIEYKGDIPSDLLKDYQEMEGLNNKAPRDRYFHLRSKTENDL